MRENRTRTKLIQGKAVLGIISPVSDPMIAEMIGLAGFDFFMVDGEHGPVSPAQVIDTVRACEAVDVTPLIRVGSKDPKLVLQYLDAGMMGIMMPGLDTVPELEMLVSAAKYPPAGKRGLGFGRAANYLMGAIPIAEYVTQANEQTILFSQFEDMALLDRLPELTAVKGVDGFVIGPVDLSMSMGFSGQPGHPRVQAVIDQAIEIIRAAGLFVGITANTGEAAVTQIARGAQIVLNSLPGLLSQGSQAFLDVARQDQATA
jgi:4-hydroxy-2-oxoheptanedioate aldolase